MRPLYYFDPIEGDDQLITHCEQLYLIEAPNSVSYHIKGISANFARLSDEPETRVTTYWPIDKQRLFALVAHNADAANKIFPDGVLIRKSLSLQDVQTYLGINPRELAALPFPAVRVTTTRPAYEEPILDPDTGDMELPEAPLAGATRALEHDPIVHGSPIMNSPRSSPREAISSECQALRENYRAPLQNDPDEHLDEEIDWQAIEPKELVEFADMVAHFSLPRAIIIYTYLIEHQQQNQALSTTESLARLRLAYLYECNHQPQEALDTLIALGTRLAAFPQDNIILFEEIAEQSAILEAKIAESAPGLHRN